MYEKKQYWQKKNASLFQKDNKKITLKKQVSSSGVSRGEHHPSNLSTSDDNDSIMNDHEALYGHHEKRLSLHHAEIAQHAADMLKLRLRARKILKNSTFFAGFKMTTVVAIVAKLERRVFAPNSIICSQGDESTEFYLIMNGSVRIFQTVSTSFSVAEKKSDDAEDNDAATAAAAAAAAADSDNVKELVQLGQYECFGETALRPMSRRRTASASAIGSVEMLVLTRDRFVALSKGGSTRMEKRASLLEIQHRKKDEKRRSKMLQEEEISGIQNDLSFMREEKKEKREKRKVKKEEIHGIEHHIKIMDGKEVEVDEMVEMEEGDEAVDEFGYV